MNNHEIPQHLLDQLGIYPNQYAISALRGFSGDNVLLLKNTRTQESFILKASTPENAKRYHAFTTAANNALQSGALGYSPYVELIPNNISGQCFWIGKEQQCYIAKPFLTSTAKPTSISPVELGQFCGHLQAGLDKASITFQAEQDAADPDHSLVGTWRQKQQWLAREIQRHEQNQDQELPPQKQAALQWLKENYSLTSQFNQAASLERYSLTDFDIRSQNIIVQNGQIKLFDPEFGYGHFMDAYKETALSASRPAPQSLEDILNQNTKGLSAHNWLQFWDGLAQSYPHVDNHIQTAYCFMALQSLIYIAINIEKLEEPLFDRFFAMNQDIYTQSMLRLSKPNL